LRREEGGIALQSLRREESVRREEGGIALQSLRGQEIDLQVHAVPSSPLD
jgi:hypothetical protein